MTVDNKKLCRTSKPLYPVVFLFTERIYTNCPCNIYTASNLLYIHMYSILLAEVALKLEICR